MVRPLPYHDYQQQNMQLQYDDDHDDAGGGEFQQRHHDTSEAPRSPTESDSTSGCSSAAASNSDRDGSPRRRAVQPQNAADQPPPVPPSTQPDISGGASACCGCTGDRECSTRPGDRSVSRGVGYCCTVQPLDRPVTPLSPQPPSSSSTVLSIPQTGGWPSVDINGSCRDELLLTAHPHLLSPTDRRSPRPQPPPLPPPRRTSLKGERNRHI